MVQEKSMFYDKSGKAMDIMDAGVLYEDAAYRCVQRTKINDNVEVSTVWLGVDHNFFGEGPPLIFESMIFGGRHDAFQERYATLEEAEIGHKVIVAMLQKELGLEYDSAFIGDV